MKKRYIVAATAALVGGGLLVEMQVGSKGLDPSQIAAPGGGGAAGGPLAGGTEVTVAARTAANRKAPRRAASAISEPEEAPATLTATTDDILALRANSSIWGDTTATNAILLSRGFAEAPTPAGNAVAALGPAVGSSYPLAGEINRASGADALSAALRQPLAASTVPEPATWLSMIVGLAMIGFNLRHRQGRRSVAS